MEFPAFRNWYRKDGTYLVCPNCGQLDRHGAPGTGPGLFSMAGDSFACKNCGARLLGGTRRQHYLRFAVAALIAAGIIYVYQEWFL